MEKEKYHIKHIELYIIGFFLAIGVAVFFFVRGCQSIDDKEPGIYEITAKKIDDVPGYSRQYEFYYYLEGNTSEINAKRQELQDLYSNELSALYATLDEDNVYKGYTSIGQINENPNTDVTVDSRVYSILQDAYNKTIKNGNYSLFADPLYAFWYESFSSLDEEIKIERDPLNNEDNKNYLLSVASYINSRDHVDLLFKGDNVVRLIVSDDYKNFRNEEEIIAPYVGLNILKDAYIIEHMTNFFVEKGYDKGYMISLDSLSSVFGGWQNTYPIYNKDLKQIGSTKITMPSVASNFRRYDTHRYSPANVYSFTKDGVTYYRSIYIDIHTGINNNAYLSSTIYSPNHSLIEATYLNNELVVLSTKEEVRSYLDNHGLSTSMVLLYYVEGEKNIYASDSLYNHVSLLEELDYNLIKF